MGSATLKKQAVIFWGGDRGRKACLFDICLTVLLNPQASADPFFPQRHLFKSPAIWHENLAKKVITYLSFLSIK